MSATYTIIRVRLLPNGHTELLLLVHESGKLIYYDTTP